ncbi:MAG TPA: hypothetical protein DCY35_06215 [Prolixibacteraceae bacterium]|nr:hypothetical protein [Prolixibacteraceae bacterium]
MAATVRDVAGRASVSIGTVSRYLNGQSLRDSNRERIEAAIRELNFKENIIAKGLKNNRSMTVGLMISGYVDFFATQIAYNIELELEKNNYSLTVCEFNNNSQRLEKKLEFLMNRSVDGIIIYVSNIYESQMLRKCVELGIPVVSINGIINGGEGIDSIVVDNANSSYQAIEYLIRSDHKRIAIINGQLEDYTYRERMQGYVKALQEYGIKMDPALISTSYQNNFLENACQSFIDIYNQLERNSRPTAVFTANMIMTYGVMKAINQLNLDCPQNISFIGFDWNPAFDVYRPPLTVVRQPENRIGILAAKLILDQLSGRRKSRTHITTIESQLKINQSVAPCKE